MIISCSDFPLLFQEFVEIASSGTLAVLLSAFSPVCPPPYLTLIWPIVQSRRCPPPPEWLRKEIQTHLMGCFFCFTSQPCLTHCGAANVTATDATASQIICDSSLNTLCGSFFLTFPYSFVTFLFYFPFA